MSRQKTILHRYRQLFPNETLKEVSTRTGIQITRVFRLFNGKNMKVGELEAFERIITNKISENPSISRLTVAVESASSLLTYEEITKIADYIERRVAHKTFSRGYVSTTHTNLIIA